MNDDMRRYLLHDADDEPRAIPDSLRQRLEKFTEAQEYEMERLQEERALAVRVACAAATQLGWTGTIAESIPDSYLLLSNGLTLGDVRRVLRMYAALEGK